MPSAVIDACCLIDLFASGHAEAILRAAAFDWHVPVAVQNEVQFVRQHDPQQPGQTIAVAADFAPLFSSAVLCVCRPEDNQELTRFTQYAAVFRSDGEAMCLAIAESRGWIVATDDRKAIRTGQAAGLTVISCPELVKIWADAAKPAQPGAAPGAQGHPVLGAVPAELIDALLRVVERPACKGRSLVAIFAVRTPKYCRGQRHTCRRRKYSSASSGATSFRGIRGQGRDRTSRMPPSRRCPSRHAVSACALCA